MRAMRQPKRERLAARVTPDQKELIQRAADLEGRTLTDYVITSVEAAARETIRAHDLMELSQEGTRAFFAAIGNPRLRTSVSRPPPRDIGSS